MRARFAQGKSPLVIGADLVSIPADAPERPDETARLVFSQLHRGVQLELEAVAQNTAEACVDVATTADELRSDWLNEQRRREWLPECKQGNVQDFEMFGSVRDLAPETGGGVTAVWVARDAEASPIRITFDEAEKTRVTIRIHFLPTRTACDQTARRWQFALDRLRTCAQRHRA
jgi:hypothetical protein